VSSSRLRILSVAAIAVLIAILLAAGGRAQPSALRLTLLASTSADRSSASPLRGRAPFGTLHAFLDVRGKGRVTRVRYVLDGKALSATRRRPYAARPISPTRLSHGPHVLEAHVAVRGEPHTRVIRARFTSVRLFSSPSGAGTTCTQASPCSDLGAAYAAAAPGQVVELAPGDYGTQGLSGTKAAPGVTFHLPLGDAVADLDIHASYVTFTGPIRLGWRAYADAHHLTFRDVRHEGFFAIWSADNVSLIGGESYCSDAGHFCDYDPQITEHNGNQDPPTDILIDRVHFHDWGRPPDSDWHTECLQGGAGVRVTIRRSTFERCATHDIFVRSWGGTNGGRHVLKDWTFENNFFGKTVGGYYAVQFVGDLTPECNGALFRNNTALEGFRTEACSALRYVGNLGVRFAFHGCDGTFRHNVWFAPEGRAAKCSATDKRVGDPGLANALSGDLRLRSTSRAVNAGDPKDYPRIDIQGEPRPQGRAPDAGADEVR
jgi:hypothetical protein